MNKPPIWKDSILDYCSPFRFRRDKDLSKAYPFNSVYGEDVEE